MASVAIHAPSANFATITTHVVSPVATAPTPLITMLRRAPRCPPSSLPVHDHACLRQRECRECADGEQRNQPVGDASEENQQQATKQGQNTNADRKHQPPSKNRKRVREVPLFRDQAAYTWKVGKGSVGGESQHRENGAHCDVVKKSTG